MTSPAFYRNHLLRDAISAALYDAMKEDPSIYLFGEGAWVKQHYDAPKILEEFPDRVLTLPISEDGNTNYAVGASLLGVKPVVDVITADFLYRTMDSICNTAAKLNFVAADGSEHRTIIIRAEFLSGGPTTGQRPEALFAHIPGLNIVVPSTPKDAYILMRDALVTPGVTIFFEDRMIQDSETKPEDMGQYPRPPLPLCARALVRTDVPGFKLTIVAYGLMRQLVESVLDEHDITDVDLLDLVTLYPLDIDTIIDNVSATEKLLIVEPDVCFGGIGAEIVAQMVEQLGTLFKVVRLGAPRETIPANREGQARMMPSREEILEAIRGLL